MRTRPWQLVLLAVVIVLALSLWQRRGQPPAPPTNTVDRTSSSPDAPPPRFTWPIGTTQTYTLQTRRVVHMRGRGQPPSDETFPLTLSAHYTTTVLRADGMLVSLLTQLDGIKLEMPGEPAAQAKLVRDLARPFLQIQEPDGKLRSLRIHREVDTIGRGFLKALAASLQFVRSPNGGSTWQSEEMDATGEYTAQYQKESDGTRCQKSRVHYLHVRAAQGLVPVSQLGKVTGSLAVTFTLSDGDDEAGRLLAAEGRDLLDVDPGPDMPLVSSESTFSLKRIKTTTVEPGPIALALLESAEYTLSPLLQMDTTDSDRRSDEQRVHGASFDQLLGALRGLPTTDNGSQRAELQTRLSSLFRIQPETTKLASQTIVAGVPEAVAKTVLGALSGAQSEAGQAALVDLLGEKKLSSDLRQNAVAVLGLSDTPSEATTEALHKALRDTDPEVRSTAALALGNAAGAQRGASQVGAAEANVDELITLYQAAQTEDEQLLYLQAMGNAGDPRTLPLLQTALQSPSSAVRSAATQALRFINATPVDALLAQLLAQDSSSEVRRAAIFACSFRQIVAVLPSLQKALSSDKEATVRQDALQLLARHREIPAVMQLIRTAAERDPSPEVRRAAAELVR
mgnify:CR=1 FL=1